MTVTVRGVSLAIAGAIAILMTTPGLAAAETTCAFTPSTGALAVEATDRTQIEADEAGDVIVRDFQAIIPGRPPTYGFVRVPCANAEAPGEAASPTTTNVEAIDVRAPYLLLEELAPGRTTAGEGSGPEVEVAFSGRTLSLEGGSGDDDARFGEDVGSGGPAVNLNAQDEPGADADVDVAAPNLTSLHYSGGGGDDTIDAGPEGTPFEGPLPASVAASLDGREGTDFLEAGLGPTRLAAGFGTTGDRLHGGPAADVLQPSNGDNELFGGGGVDSVEFYGAPGVTVDLGVTGPQGTGRGTKVIHEVENLVGTQESDTLVGDDGANTLESFGGLDVVIGGAGDDTLTASGRLDGGEGDDRLRGGSGRDRLLGGGGDDDLRGSTGVDVLLGGPGLDLLRAREPRPFTGRPKGDRRIDCGPGSDREERATTDEEDPEPVSC